MHPFEPHNFRGVSNVKDEETARMLLRKTTSFYEDKASEAMSNLKLASMTLQQCFHFLRNIVIDCILLTA